MSPLRPSAIAAILAFFGALPAFAATPDDWFGDHMVVQRDHPLVVWGTGTPGEAVTVSFHGEQAQTKVGVEGRFEATLPAFAADVVDAPGTELRVQGVGAPAVLKDVLVGDVWLCAGQSNMEFPLSDDADAKAALAQSAVAGLRLRQQSAVGRFAWAKAWTAQEVARLTPDRLYAGQWAVSSAQAAAPMSAVGWYFGREIVAKSAVPVGIVNYSVGGSPLEAWIPESALAKTFPEKVRGDWLANAHLPAWCATRGRQNLLGTASPPGDATGPFHTYKPGFLWAASGARLTKAQMAGILWYQGESNAVEMPRVLEYGRLFGVMVESWRREWGRPDLPFLFVQLPGIGKIKDRLFWPQFREEQRRIACVLPRTAMAVALDLGARNDVHPRKKREVGLRLARLAEKMVYGKEQVVTGPWPASARAEGGKAVVAFAGTGGRLSFKGQGDPVLFELAGADGVFHPAQAEIRGDAVSLAAAKVAVPAQVRYAFAHWPSSPLLVGADDLPAPAFVLPVPYSAPVSRPVSTPKETP